MKTTLWMLFATAAVIAVAFSAAHLRAQGPAIPVPIPQFVSFGMVGLADGQTARLNALGLVTGGPAIAGASCEVTLEFFNDQGVSLKTSSALKIVGGQSVLFDLQRGDIDKAADRREIRGTVRTNFNLPPGILTPVAFQACTVVPTMEIFNQDTGRTMSVLESTHSQPLLLPLAAGQ